MAASESIPERVWALLRAHGQDFSLEIMAEQRSAFAALLGPIEAPRTVRDLDYGTHERQQLDVHLPAGDAGEPRPIVLYVHGGGFVAGDRRQAGQPYFDNVGAWCAANGWVGATMSYRRAPEYRWPAGAEDIRSALQTLRARAAEFAGDPDRIVLFGHSAGAAHVAGYLAGHAGGVEPGLAAVILQSGIYDPHTADDEIADMVAMYYGDADASAVAALRDLAVPLYLSVGEYDPSTFHRQAARVREPEVAPGHGHFSTIYAFGLDAAHPARVARFVRNAVAGAAS